MLSLSYTVSPQLRNQLLEIESLRRDIVLVPLSPQTELALRFQSLLKRLYLYAQSSPHPLAQSEILSLLTHPSPLPFVGIPTPKLNLLLYKRGLDHLTQHWLVNSQPVTAKILTDLSHAITLRIKIHQSNADYLLDYLNSKSDNPWLLSALAFQTFLQQKFPPPTPQLLAYLFLYKFGYDIRQLLILEPTFTPQPNLSSYLDFYVQTITYELLQLKSQLASGKISPDFPSSPSRLSDRQAEILTSFPDPDSKITNQKIQRLFGISQVTASRDLSRLASLNLLFSHGKGRSVYYTKI